MRILFTPSARTQFLSAIANIHSDKPRAAQHFRHRAETMLKRLKRFPVSGLLIPEFPELPHHELIVTPYRFFYRVRGQVVWIVAVWHGAQIPGAPMNVEDA